ncbi:MAG: hypothetical protein AAGU19_07165 [Prolixibacteraceae bacterium]
MEHEANIQTPAEKLISRENLKEFYREQLPNLLKTVFLNPIAGTYSIFKHTTHDTYKNSVLLILSTMTLYFMMPLLIIGGEMRSLISFSMLLRFSLVAGLFILLISAISFGIKSVSGKPVFKNELLTGALCGIGLILLLIVLLLIRFFVGDLNIFELMNPMGLLRRIGFMLVFVLYIFLFMVNVMQQSLKASGTNDAVSWYISPVTILLAFYLTSKIAQEIFLP